MQLPTHTKSIEALKSLEMPVKWEELFINRSPFRLCYSLQILNWLLEDRNESQSRSEWSIRFVENEGMDHLLILLSSLKMRDNSTNCCDNVMKFQQNSVIRRACLGFLLKAISIVVGM